jgi:CheY-like chemotaxis protein
VPPYGRGPRAQRVYELLRGRITDGDLPAGHRLPAHPALAEEFGVSPVTMRQVLARLAEEGLVSSKPGRGTIVEGDRAPAALVVEDDPVGRALLSEHVARAGLQVLAAATPEEGLAILARERAVVLVLSDIRMPTPEAGVEFIRAVRRRWPDLPLAAVTAYPGDLAALHGSPEWPVLVIPKPFHGRQILEAVRLAFPQGAARRPARLSLWAALAVGAALPTSFRAERGTSVWAPGRGPGTPRSPGTT